ncbi:MAG: carboxypeptidase-like regulatory domain-containing protein [Nitrososphaerales archaeon]
MIVRKATASLLILVILIGMTPALNPHYQLHLASAQTGLPIPFSMELGYSPSSLASIENGVPIYAPNDSVWSLSGSNSVVTAQLLTPTGGVVATRVISPETVSRLYTFSAKDPEGGWTLELTPQNSPVAFVMTIPFVNPSLHQTSVKMSNFSMHGGELNLGFAFSATNVYNMESCLASADVNSTIVIPIPSSIGRGEMLLNGNIHNATVSIKGVTSQTFSFWYELDYSYSYSGNVIGEVISRDVTTVSSSNALFTTVAPENVTLTNSTDTRPGRYELNAYFSDGGGLIVEQTRALVLDNGGLLWLGDCSSIHISGQSFNTTSDLTLGPRTWPTSLYLMYEVQGVDSYTALSLGLNQTRIHFVSSIGNTTLPYLGFSVGSNPNILASEVYNGALYIIGRDFPLSLQVTPSFGSDNLQTQSVVLNSAFTDNQFKLPIGALSIRVTNGSGPLQGATISVENDFSGETGSISGLDGRVIIYLPAGQYDVTATNNGQSISKSVELSTGTQSSLQFSFVTNPSTDYLQYVLVSLLIIGLGLNIWVWIIRPKQVK